MLCAPAILTPSGGAGQRERASELALDGAQRAQDVVGVAAHARRAPALVAPRAPHRAARARARAAAALAAALCAHILMLVHTLT